MIYLQLPTVSIKRIVKSTIKDQPLNRDDGPSYSVKISDRRLTSQATQFDGYFYLLTVVERMLKQQEFLMSGKQLLMV